MINPWFTLPILMLSLTVALRSYRPLHHHWAKWSLLWCCFYLAIGSAALRAVLQRQKRRAALAARRRKHPASPRTICSGNTDFNRQQRRNPHPRLS